MAARFRAAVGLVTPLRIQLAAPAAFSTSAIELVSVEASGNGTTGTASRPVLSRPSTLGKGNGIVLPLRNGAVAQATVITNFTSAPSYPAVDIGTINLPVRITWKMNPGQGVLVPSGTALLFYAYSSGGHTWNGAIEWEEK